MCNVINLLIWPRLQSTSAPLENITFRARPGELTAVLSRELGERRTIMELIAGRRSYGEFDGDVFLHGNIVDPSRPNLAYVSKVFAHNHRPVLPINNALCSP